MFNEKFSLNQDFSKISEISKISEPKSCQSFNPENRGSDIGGIFDLFNFDNSTNDDFEEQIFAGKHKKRKKKQRKL